MAFKLLEAAEDRWRAVNAPHLVALVRAGTRFERGRLIERELERLQRPRQHDHLGPAVHTSPPPDRSRT
jgi:hypothetical protein